MMHTYIRVKLLVPWLESINPEALGVTPVCRSAHSDPAARVPTVPKLVELALELMHLHHSPHGLLLFVEDAQWLDALSFEFFAKVLIAHPRLALIMALRYDVQRSESARRSSCSAGNSSRRYSNEAMSEATEKVPPAASPALLLPVPAVECGGLGGRGRGSVARGRGGGAGASAILLWPGGGGGNSQTTPATTSTSSICQLLGAADTQTAHPATFSTAPAHQLLGSANAETTPAGAPAVAADRTQRPDATCEGKNR